MTTIAANPTNIACDLQFTYGGHTKFKGATKILELEGATPLKMFGCQKVYIGFAGDANKWGNIISWIYSDPLNTQAPRSKNLEFLMLTDKNQIFHGTSFKNWMLIEEKHFAIGSGCNFAMAAMGAGKTPQQAIEVTSQYDLHTGLGTRNYVMKKSKQ